MNEFVSLLFWVVIAAAGIAVYFLPALTAVLRNHKDNAAVFVINLFAGWTLIGWIVAMVWAVKAGCEMPVKDEPETRRLGRHQSLSIGPPK